MDYFNILKLKREPFSNSPDPDFFFHSRQHQLCLQKLELALRLRRGLNVVLGDVGTGKTTLCRQLIRRFADDPDIETHLILDPDIADPEEFLGMVAEMLIGSRPEHAATPWQLKETVKKTLFRKGVDQRRTVVLIIDEGQKIPPKCLELLREFLNFETNEHKLLQIAIFAQTEFQQTLHTHANFADRINLLHTLGPVNFKDTRQMIRFRIDQSRDAQRTSDLFTFPALFAVYRATGGYPRKIVHLCHQCLLAVIIQNKTRAGWALVRSCSRRGERTGRLGWWLPAGVAALVLVVTGLLIVAGPSNDPPPENRQQGAPLVEQPSVAAPPPPIVGTQPPTGKNGGSGRTADGEPPAADRKPAETADLIASAPPEKTLPAENAAGPKPPAAKQETEGPERTGQIAPPDTLGRVTLGNRETLWRLVEKVYGSHDPRYLQSVQEANPHIRDLDRVEVGEQIIVPAIPTRVQPSGQRRIWVRLAEARTLDSAVDMLRNHPPEAPPIRVIPHWNHRNGLSFSVLLKSVYYDDVSARSQSDRITRVVGSTPELVSSWAPDTIFYANPYRIPRL